MAKAQRSLQDFIFRGEALKLYREFIRTTRSVPKQSQGKYFTKLLAFICLIVGGARCRYSPLNPAIKTYAGELRAEIRREFDSHREVPDRHTQKFLLSDGRTRLKQLSEMLGMQR
jgi:hypothetical protein